MRPIAIFRHAPADGPGAFSDYLHRRGWPQTLVRVDHGDPLPHDPRRFAGLAFMGGPMSVNDDLPWIEAELALIRAAVEAGIPVIGHCLGGQLMSKALGGAVSRNPAWEIGWHPVDVVSSETARSWFDDTEHFLSFHWHGETFSIPPGAERIAASALCGNQAFALGPHLGMQCHVEMTEPMIREWIAGGAEDLRKHAGPGVQSVRDIEQEIAARVAALAQVSARLYARWLSGLGATAGHRG